MTWKASSLGIVANLVLGQPAAAQTAVDGDTIELKGASFRLHASTRPNFDRSAPMAGLPAARHATISAT